MELEKITRQYRPYYVLGYTQSVISEVMDYISDVRQDKHNLLETKYAFDKLTKVMALMQELDRVNKEQE
jgi:hypothetical protein